VNEVFKKDYPEDCDFVIHHSDHEGDGSSGDFMLRFEGAIFHVYYQSSTDFGFLVRMDGFSFMTVHAIPLIHAIPASCVLFLRHTNKTPDVQGMEIELPDGTTIDSEAKVLKAQLIEKEELFDKRLLILLPYYLLRYESQLSHMGAGDEHARRIVEEFADLHQRLVDAMIEHGDALLYEQLTELMVRVSDHMAQKNEDLQQKLRAALRGDVLEQVRQEQEQSMAEMAEALVDLGVDAGLIQEAMRLVRDRH